MFQVQPKETGRPYRIAVICLLLLSLVALGITVWVELDFLQEQEIVEELIATVPAEELEPVQRLAGELRWQFRLTILVLLNVAVTAVAVALLSRAYNSSQASLRDIKALAGDILGSMDQAVLTTDRDGRLTSINRRGFELTGCSQEHVGQTLDAVKPVPLKRFLDDWQVQDSASYTADFDIKVGVDKRILRASCQSLTDVDSFPIGHVLQILDVTKTALIENRMRRMQRYMGLGSLAVGLHHEIKNPLAALSLHVQLLEENLHEDPDETDRTISVIHAEVSRIGVVLENFRDFASLDQLNLTSVDLAQLVANQLALLKPQADSQSVTVSNEITLPNDCIVTGDQVRLEQVLLNVLVNALQAMPDGGKISTGIDLLEDEVVVRVTDTGPGIRDDLHDKILDPYFTTKSGGSGLGLALGDKILRQHGGSLDFSSTPHGTTFFIKLPRGDHSSCGGN